MPKHLPRNIQINVWLNIWALAQADQHIKLTIAVGCSIWNIIYTCECAAIKYTHAHTNELDSSSEEGKEGSFPGGGPVVKNLSWSAGDMCSIPGWGIKMPHATQTPQSRPGAAK